MRMCMHRPQPLYTGVRQDKACHSRATHAPAGLQVGRFRRASHPGERCGPHTERCPPARWGFSKAAGQTTDKGDREATRRKKRRRRYGSKREKTRSLVQRRSAAGPVRSEQQCAQRAGHVFGLSAQDLGTHSGPTSCGGPRARAAPTRR